MISNWLILLLTCVIHFKLFRTESVSELVRYKQQRYNYTKRKYELGYLKDSNAAEHSVDSDVFNEVIHLPASFKTYINLYCFKVVPNREQSVLV